MAFVMRFCYTILFHYFVFAISAVEFAYTPDYKVIDKVVRAEGATLDRYSMMKYAFTAQWRGHGFGLIIGKVVRVPNDFCPDLPSSGQDSIPPSAVQCLDFRGDFFMLLKEQKNLMLQAKAWVGADCSIQASREGGKANCQVPRKLQYRGRVVNYDRERILLLGR